MTVCGYPTKTTYLLHLRPYNYVLFLLKQISGPIFQVFSFFFFIFWGQILEIRSDFPFFWTYFSNNVLHKTGSGSKKSTYLVSCTRLPFFGQPLVLYPITAGAAVLGSGCWDLIPDLCKIRWIISGLLQISENPLAPSSRTLEPPRSFLQRDRRAC